MPRNNKLNDASAMSMSYDEDIDESSIMGCHRSSAVGSAFGAMSDLDSTIDRGLVASLTRQIAVEDDKNNRNSVVSGCEDDEEGTIPSRAGIGGSRDRPFIWMYRRWADFVSRVSRAASSLLNQHSHNLNDLLDVTAETHLEVQPQREVLSSISEHQHQSWPQNSMNDERDGQILALQNEVAILKKRIQEMEYERDSKNCPSGKDTSTSDHVHDIPPVPCVQMLRPDQVTRYSRQLLLKDGFGVIGQKKLLSSSILVIGAGGIGSTVLMYLAAVGVGHITIVDYDCIEMTNLHRQVIHKDSDASKRVGQVGLNKAISAKNSTLALNPTVSCTALAIAINAKNALKLVSNHDVVVDACDNPQTRYLLNDACVLAGKPLVSGSAMGTEGQLTVYNFCQPNDGASDQTTKRTACYRCLYPKPVVAEGCKSCSDNGVLGMVPGAIGILQAVEVVKVVTGIGSIMHNRLMMYDSLHCSFHSIKKPPPITNCAVCSPNAIIKTMVDSERSMENVRGPVPSACVLPPRGTLAAEQNVSCLQYSDICKNGLQHVLLDVRQTRQYEMCSLDGAINLPLDGLELQLDTVGQLSRGEIPVYCICRRGIASAEATRILQKSIDDGNAYGIHSVYNISGGLNSWVETVDADFPHY
ncbi:hypothetical protein ACHAXH_005602 [Discostella pseudostelligera]